MVPSVSYKHIPDEIVEIILANLDTSTDIFACLCVNSHWFAVALPLLYADIKMELSFSDNIYDTLISSEYMPGGYVKKIHFKETYDVPACFLDCETSPLLILMEHCPQVEQVTFDSSFAHDPEWYRYFFNAFTQKNVWKLKTLPDIFSYYSLPHEFRCLVSQLQDSLTAIRIDEQLDIFEFDFLEECQQLKSLQIPVSQASDYTSILKFTPTLDRLHVDFSRASTDNEEGIWNRNDVQPSQHLKQLEFFTYTPISDDELLFMPKTFKTLEKVILVGSCLPITLDNATVLDSFFKFIMDIPDSLFSFYLLNEVTWLQAYYDRFNQQCKGSFPLHFQFGSMDTTESSSNDQEEPCLMLRTSEFIELSNNTTNERVIQNIIRRNVRAVRYCIDTLEIFVLESVAVLPLLQAVFNEDCTSLKYLSFNGGHMDSELLPTTSTSRSINKLVLRDVHLTQDSLPILSTYFASIEFLELDMDDFMFPSPHLDSRTSEENMFGEVALTLTDCDIYLDMGNSGIGSLAIKSRLEEYDLGYIAFVRIYTSDNKPRLFYVKSSYDNVLLLAEIQSKQEFDMIIGLCSKSAEMVYSVVVVARSINVFSFTSPAISFNITL